MPFTSCISDLLFSKIAFNFSTSTSSSFSLFAVTIHSYKSSIFLWFVASSCLMDSHRFLFSSDSFIFYVSNRFSSVSTFTFWRNSRAHCKLHFAKSTANLCRLISQSIAAIASMEASSVGRPSGIFKRIYFSSLLTSR
jgi:hypothetical protein